MPLLPEPLPAGPVRPRLPQPLYQLEPPAPVARHSAVRLKTALYRQRWLVAAVIVLFVLVAAALTWMIPPHFVAEGSIIIEPPSQRLAELNPPTYYPTYDEDRELQTEMTVLTSRAIALPVIQQLHLEQNDPDIHEALANAERGAKKKGERLSPARRDQIATDVFGHNLTVQPDKLSRTVHVTYVSSNPGLAATVVNTTLHEFTGYARSQRMATASKAAPWLQQQLADAQRRLNDDNANLVAFQQAHTYTPLLVPGGQQGVLLDRLADANKGLSAAEAERINSEALLHTYPGSIEALPTALRTPELEAAITARATARTELTQLESTYRPDFPLVVAARERYQKAQQQLDALRAEVNASLAKNYQAALQRQTDMQSLVSQLSHQAASEGTVETRYQMLKQKQVADQQLYDTLRQKLNEEQLVASLPTSNVRVLDAAEKPVSPAYPRLALDLGLGLVLGLVFGVGTALGRERWRDTLTGPGELQERMGQDMAPLTVIPDQQRLLDRALKDLPPGEAGGPGEESYARLAAQLMAGRQAPFSVLLTSANPGEGKTMTTCRLGQSLARAGWRTLILDADLRRPGCHSFFSVDNSHGLLAAQQGEAVTPIHIGDSLDLMPCEVSSSQPLQPRRVATLMEQWRQQYDCILVDSPPGILTGEAVLLAPLVDGVVVVLQWGRTRADDAEQLGSLLARTGTPLLGSVLNRVDPSAPSFRYYRRHYSYFTTPAVVR